MNIALDYDKTYSLDKIFWDRVVFLARECSHDIRIVTARSPRDDVLSAVQCPIQKIIPVIYCDGVAKKFHTFWKEGFNVDVWIDDKPEGILNNSTATPEILAAWRAAPEYHY